MKSEFSKSTNDVRSESLRHLKDNDKLLEQQQRISSVLNQCPDRLNCIVCGKLLADLFCFRHRAVDYISCPNCGHIQSKAQPPIDYPVHNKEDGVSFSQIYPRLDRAAYNSRKERIYRPKLKWILRCHEEVGLSQDDMIASRWMDLGCGGGYFLAALQDMGADQICGLEKSSDLISVANEALGRRVVQHYEDTLVNAVQNCDADIYTAFFVLEHIEDTRAFFEALRRRPTGTVFAFSVPTFGFATLLESSFVGHFARNLDSVIHTQLYTDSSIDYALSQAGYERVAEWVFGQDALDLSRALLVNMRDKYPATMLKTVSESLVKIQDQMQVVLDQHYLASERHILAVKKR